MSDENNNDHTTKQNSVKYLVITGNCSNVTIDSFNDKVNKACNIGYVPLGNLKIDQTSNSNYIYRPCYQALIKK